MIVNVNLSAYSAALYCAPVFSAILPVQSLAHDKPVFDRSRETGLTGTVFPVLKSVR
jgi:hypothetical protein